MKKFLFGRRNGKSTLSKKARWMSTSCQDPAEPLTEAEFNRAVESMLRPRSNAAEVHVMYDGSWVFRRVVES